MTGDSYREAIKILVFGPGRPLKLAGPKPIKYAGAKANNTCWGKSQQKHAGAKANKTCWGQSQQNKKWPKLSKQLVDHIMNHHTAAAAAVW